MAGWFPWRTCLLRATRCWLLFGPPCLCLSEQEGRLRGEGSRAAGRAWEPLTRALERPPSASLLSQHGCCHGGQRGAALANRTRAELPTGPGHLASISTAGTLVLPRQMNPADQASRGAGQALLTGPRPCYVPPAGHLLPTWALRAFQLLSGSLEHPKAGRVGRGGNRHTGAVLARGRRNAQGPGCPQVGRGWGGDGDGEGDTPRTFYQSGAPRPRRRRWISRGHVVDGSCCHVSIPTSSPDLSCLICNGGGPPHPALPGPLLESAGLQEGCGAWSFPRLHKTEAPEGEGTCPRPPSWVWTWPS